jgi:hypothetical protein
MTAATPIPATASSLFLERIWIIEDTSEFLRIHSNNETSQGFIYRYTREKGAPLIQSRGHLKLKLKPGAANIPWFNRSEGY